MDKIAYVTLMTKEIFLPCIIRQAQRSRYLKLKYPFIVLVTDNMNYSIIKILQKNNIKYKIIPYLTFNSSQKIYNDTINKFYCLTLTDYDKIFFFDADMLFTSNLDEYIEQIQFTEGQFLLRPIKNQNKNQKINNDLCSGESFFCRPSIEEFKKIKKELNNNSFFSSDQLAFSYYYKNCIQDYPTPNGLVHLANYPKIWDIKEDDFINNLFYKYNEQDFNNLFEKIKDDFCELIYRKLIIYDKYQQFEMEKTERH